MINNTSRNSQQPPETSNQKIPSLFDVALPIPAANSQSGDQEDQDGKLLTCMKQYIVPYFIVGMDIRVEFTMVKNLNETCDYDGAYKNTLYVRLI